MYSTLQRLNNITSLATTYIMILLGLISVASFLSVPTLEPGNIDIKDLIVTKGRLRRWGAKTEELASLRFDVKTNLNPILHSYNTKQLFIYLTATYDETHTTPTTNMTVGEHEVVLWDRIITRSDMKDLRATGQKVKTSGGPKKGRGNVRVEEGKTKYQWRNPSGTLRHVPTANFTLHYSLMPYVGILSSGVAATARGPVTLPEVLKR